MSQQPKIQVPINEKLKKGLKKKAESLGFSSVNEAVRLLIQNFVNGNISIQFVQPSINQELSMLDYQTEVRIIKSLKEIEQGDCELIDFDKNPNALKDLLS